MSLCGLAILLLALVSCRTENPPQPGITPTTGKADITATIQPTVTSQPTQAPSPTASPTFTVTVTPSPTLPAAIHFAVIGDYGLAGNGEAQVAGLVHSWKPDFIITTGDNNYYDGSQATIDANIGQYYHDYIFPYLGNFGAGADKNRFFPVLGNHDWHAPQAKPYLDYFTLPGNERYYDYVWGPVHFFALDSDPSEPDGFRIDSIQANWLKNALASAVEPWKLVYMHHPSYSSARHGSTSYMQWPFDEWGVNVVLAGHDHTYERLEVKGVYYLVDGLGGDSRYQFNEPLASSLVRYRDAFGALLVTADATEMIFKFINVKDETIDQFTLHATSP